MFFLIMKGSGMMSNNKNIKVSRLTPLLKYPGGKESELKYIHRTLPKNIRNYYEPFLGGAAVYLSIEADEYYVNDKSKELMQFYNNVLTQNTEFIIKLEAINHNWKLITEFQIDPISYKVTPIYNM